MKVISLIGFIIVLFLLISCSNNQNTVTKKITNAKETADSIALAKRKDDSISIATLKEKRIVPVSDKTITVLDKAKTTKQLRFELDNTGYGTYYRQKIAERDMTFLTIRIKLSSKSKYNNSGGNFFPNLNVFSVDEKNNSIIRIGEMGYQLYKKDDLNTAFLEQIFDYKESEDFVCWIELNTPISRKVVISANTNKSESFDKNTVIAIINGIN